MTVDLKFRSLREVLDEAIPADVAQIGLDGTSAPHNLAFDSDMTLLKGLMAGTLGMVDGAVGFIHKSSDDMDERWLASDWDDNRESEFQAVRSDSVDAGVSLDQLDFDLTFAEWNARIYYGHTEPDRYFRLDLTAPSADGESLYGFSVQVRYFAAGTLQKDENSELAEVMDVVLIQMEAEGGPPSDFFFIRTLDGAVPEERRW